MSIYAGYFYSKYASYDPATGMRKADYIFHTIDGYPGSTDIYGGGN